MTVQTTAGPPVFTPGEDFIRVDRGVSWGIKCRISGGPQTVDVCVQAPRWHLGHRPDDAGAIGDGHRHLPAGS